MYYNENTIVYFKGEFIKAVDVRSNIYDQTIHYGYGAFEGIRAYATDGGVKIFKAMEHFDRMKFSCEAVQIPYPYDNEKLIAISYEVLERNNLKNAYLRPLVTCTPNMSLSKGISSQLLIAAWEWGAYLGHSLLDIMISTYRRPNPSGFKVAAKITGHYINSILACQDAKDKGFDEALLLDVDGYVAEGPGANVFFEVEGKLITPQTGSILPGITRATILEICNDLDIEVEERRILPEEIMRADSGFFCGTAAEVIGIHSIDRIPFKKEWNESKGFLIQQAYKKLVLGKDYSLLVA